MDFRKIYDTIPEKFDKWRPRYCDGLFADIIEYAKLDSGKSALEIGSGTGQATEPILKTGCSYLAIELGENLAGYTKNKFNSYSNFNIVNADFEKYDFGENIFDLVYSAAAIQWIPENVGFPKVNEVLKSGGTFAMMMTHTDEKSANVDLYNAIQEVYKKHFVPEEKYKCKLDYNNVLNYGFADFERRTYKDTIIFTAEEYVSYIGTHCEHITLQEPYKTLFYDGIKNAVLSFGNKITHLDDIILYLVKKL
jgi:SAM-dependent methyltransferase